MSQDVETTPEQRAAAVRAQLALLWQPEAASARGPRRSLGLDDVVEAAVRVADTGGLEQMSMRKVAAELGIGAMSLYTYVPGRDELLELMIDHVAGEAAAPDTSGTWRERVSTWARERYAMVLRHGWVLDASATRDVLGPHVMDAQEALFQALLGTGLDALEVVGTANALQWFVNGAAGVVVGEEAVTRRTGQDISDYYAARTDFWTTFFDGERYPGHVELWQAGAFDDTSGFDFEVTLQRILDGIAARLDPSAAGVVAG